MVDIFTLLVLVLVFFFTVYLLYKYASFESPVYVLGAVFFSWLLALITIALIPYDVNLVLAGQGNQQILLSFWLAIYWSNFLLCWIALPLLQEYIDAADFTFCARVRSCFYYYLRTLLIIGAVGLGFLVYFIAVGTMTLEKLPAFLVAASNCWGLTLVIILLGYGLVAIPKSFWYRGNQVKTLEYLYFQAALIDQEMEEHKSSLDDLVVRVEYLRENAKSERVRQHLEVVSNKCPHSSKERFKIKKALVSLKPEKLTQEDLVNLHKEVIKSTKEYHRSKW